MTDAAIADHVPPASKAAAVPKGTAETWSSRLKDRRAESGPRIGWTLV